MPLPCPATEREDKIFAELTEEWLAGKWGDGPLRGQDRLFPYTLLKSFLSSHRALAATVAERLKKWRRVISMGSIIVWSPFRPG